MTDIYVPTGLVCPLCGGGLSLSGGSLKCTGERPHTYDVSREGYVNLLPPGRAKNAHTGDGADMIRARRDFLRLGHYDKYPELAATAAAPFLPQTEDGIVFADAGCGEGHHTEIMARTLCRETGESVTAIGLDASKHGAAAAARAFVKGGTQEDRRFFFAAANIFRMPLRDSSVHMVTSLFAPLPEEEVRRVLVPGGVLLICAAGGEHLSQLREVLYDTPIPSGGGAAVPHGFSVARECVADYTVSLASAEEVASLFLMTPFYHNATEAARQRVAALSSLTARVQVRVTVAVKDP